MVSGYKTYLVAAALVILSGLLMQGYITQKQFEMLISLLNGLGLAALRDAVKKGQ